MYLYNIHTHQLENTRVAGCQIRCILNTFPEDFYLQKSLYPHTWFSCGIHPWYAADADIDQVRKIVAEPEVVAVGEVGLDKLKGPALSIQIEVFRQQIELAVEYDKPLIIHCVKAWDELIALRKEYQKYNIPWVIHGYRGSSEQTQQLSKLGFLFSLGEKFNTEGLEHIPLDCIFCETDISDLTICKVYENVSQKIGVNKNHFATLVAHNVAVTFRISDKGIF